MSQSKLAGLLAKVLVEIDDSKSPPTEHRGERRMGRDIILWLAGVPLVVIIGLHLFGFLH